MRVPASLYGNGSDYAAKRSLMGKRGCVGVVDIHHHLLKSTTSTRVLVRDAQRWLLWFIWFIWFVLFI
jgi:hypothetical protein